MTDNDYSRIQVGDTPIGLRGLKGAIEEIAQSHGDKSDGEIAQALLAEAKGSVAG